MLVRDEHYSTGFLYPVLISPAWKLFSSVPDAYAAAKALGSLAMSLTGSLFLGTVVAVTVLSFVAVVLWWPALAGRGVARVAGRAGMLVLLNALVLLTAGALLNAQFLFFADWTDLRGAFGGVPTSTAVSRGTTASRAAPVVQTPGERKLKTEAMAIETGITCKAPPTPNRLTINAVKKNCRKKVSIRRRICMPSTSASVAITMRL